MERKTIIVIPVVLLTIFFISLGVMVRSMEDSNSWTKALCGYVEGELEQKTIYDTCWIEGKEYRAKFVRTGEHYNNETNSDEIKRWKLIKR